MRFWNCLFCFKTKIPAIVLYLGRIFKLVWNCFAHLWNKLFSYFISYLDNFMTPGLSPPLLSELLFWFKKQISRLSHWGCCIENLYAFHTRRIGSMSSPFNSSDNLILISRELRWDMLRRFLFPPNLNRSCWERK